LVENRQLYTPTCIWRPRWSDCVGFLSRFWCKKTRISKLLCSVDCLMTGSVVSTQRWQRQLVTHR